MGLDRRHIIAAATAVALAVAPAAARDLKSEETKRDLHDVISLEGYHCGEVIAYTSEGEDRYDVVCQNGERYAVRIVDQRSRVSVTRATEAGAEPDAKRPTHEEHVKRVLFSLVALTGGDCDEVVDFQRVSPKDHVAACSNGKRYRVRVQATGRVAVEAQ